MKRVHDGEIVRFETMDCFSNQIRREEQLIEFIDFNRLNPAAGPIHLEGAAEGDILAVQIRDITVQNQGIVSTMRNTGPFYRGAKDLRTKINPIKGGKIVFNDVSFEFEPMIGVIGVAPKNRKITNGFPGSHGGNKDCKKIVKHSRVYFPVQVPGALLQLGDLHAAMGDGEICGTGVEISGEVEVQLNLIKNTPLDWPVVETDDRWYVIASDVDIEVALKEASQQSQQLIVKAFGWDEVDAAMYLSIRGDLEFCQACKPSAYPSVVRFSIPKEAGKPGLIGR